MEGKLHIMFTCILIYKKYIDSCRLKKCLPSSDVFIQQIKRYKNLELYSLYLYPHQRQIVSRQNGILLEMFLSNHIKCCLIIPLLLRAAVSVI